MRFRLVVQLLNLLWRLETYHLFQIRLVGTWVRYDTSSEIASVEKRSGGQGSKRAADCSNSCYARVDIGKNFNDSHTNNKSSTLAIEKNRTPENKFSTKR